MLVRLIRNLARVIANALRRLLRPAQYVQFTLSGEIPLLPAPRGGLLRRFLPTKLSLREIEQQLQAVAQDPRVKGVVLHLHPLKLPWAGRQALRAMIVRLRDAGKTVVAWATAYDTARYHIATACHRILLQPGGRIEPLGLAQHYIFVADALQRVGLAADFVQISPYKTAADMLMRREMSEAAREMANWLVEDLYEQWVLDVAAARAMDPEAVRVAVDESPYTDEAAQNAGLIDELINEEALPSALAPDRRPAKVAPFRQVRRMLVRPLLPLSPRAIGILRICGDIIDGRSSRPPARPPFRIPLLLSERAGDLSVVDAARWATKNRRIAAVVVYVDSGGGSATSSEAMASALQRLAEHKPVVVCMGAVAASGGYYVATPGKWVVAQPGTITGSIGVLSGKLVGAPLLAKLGIHDEWIDRGEGMSLQRGDDAYTDAEREIVWRGVRRTYDLFLERVAVGRGLAVDKVDAVGGGRVWTGRQAMERGLVDALGGLHDALAKAKDLAGLHPRAAVRDIHVRGVGSGPVPSQTSDLLTYATEGLPMLRGGVPLCLCPLITLDD